ncbi:MAG: hypothetical protein U0807_16805 [Candidatus Binatia bacterium]
MASSIMGRSAEMAVRSLVAPGILAARWLTRSPDDAAGDVPRPVPSVGLTAKVLLDELFLAVELISAEVVSFRDRDRLATEVHAALDLYQREGWLDDPEPFHGTPPALGPGDVEIARPGTRGFRHLRFESAYAPHPGEPGRERWLAHEANRTAHAWILEHPGAPRPWLVCIPGYRMGHPLVDFTGFPARWLHQGLGLNVAIPVMPLHGPRTTAGRRSGDGFLTGDYIDTIHLQTQAVWDIRRLFTWLRTRGEPPVGIYGVSLGGCTTALLASLEGDLACAIAGMPATCYVDLARQVLPDVLLRLGGWVGLHWDAIERLVRVISPFALRPRVPRERRFLFGGAVDRLVQPAGVRALWEHWERPRLEWYAGSHVSFGWETEVGSLLAEALDATGLTAA